MIALLPIIGIAMVPASCFLCSKYLAKRTYRLDNSIPTPAYTRVDFIPTNMCVL